VVATGLVGGYAIARFSGRRELGGLFLAACGIWSARQWNRRGGPRLAIGLGLTYAAAFGASHPLAKTLFAVDELTGFIAAVALVRPEGIAGMTPKSVKKKLKQPSFAAAVSRDDMRLGAEELGEDFDQHLSFVIAALEPRAEELGLTGEATTTGDAARGE
jgi:hypothetical protein